MDILGQLFHEKELEKLLEKCADIKYLKKEEVRKIILLFKSLNCDDNLIRYFIMNNPFFLLNGYDKLYELISALDEYGVKDLDLTIYLYPNILNKDVYELDNFYIKKHQEGYSNEDINELLEIEPYLIDC